MKITPKIQRPREALFSREVMRPSFSALLVSHVPVSTWQSRFVICSRSCSALVRSEKNALRLAPRKNSQDKSSQLRDSGARPMSLRNVIERTIEPAETATMV